MTNTHGWPGEKGTRTTIRPIFAWYDLWVGVFIDRPMRRAYFFPIPCFGIVVQFPYKEKCGAYIGCNCRECRGAREEKPTP